jgi:glycosyltransferase involved in cell wall biosynthesis
MSAKSRSVMHVVHSLNLGGAERLAARLATTLSDEFDILVACLDDAGLWASEVRSAGVPVVELDRQPGVDATMPVRLAALGRRHGVRLLHAHQYTPFFYATLARAALPRAKVLFHEHGRHFPEVESPKRVAFNKIVLRPLTSKVVAVSAECKERVVRYEGLPPDLVEVVYNGVDAPPPPDAEARRRIRTGLGLAPDDLVAGTVGRLDPVKNVPMAVASVATLISRGMHRLRLLVIGDGPARAAIEASVRAHGLEDVAVMTGYRDDASALVGAMDLFLLPSFTEGTSLALVSAMAAAVPSVATAVGGTPEVLEDGVTGVLTPSGDEAALTRAMGELLADPDRRRAMGEAAHRAYLDRFTWDGMIDRFRAIYRQMLS